MSLETSMDLEDQVEAFNYEYEENLEEGSENRDNDSLSQSEKASSNSLLAGIGDFVGNNYSLLFFFLLLVIIFNGTGTFSESNESLLFFFLILVIIFNQFY